MITKLEIVFMLITTVSLGACGSDTGYDNNDLELAVRQKAKETCSCLFVMELSEQQCAAWTRVTPDVAKPKIDWDAKRVESHALGFWSASAHYEERTGCVLDD
jgi:hypothetical protein